MFDFEQMCIAWNVTCILYMMKTMHTNKTVTLCWNVMHVTLFIHSRSGGTH